MAGACSGIDTEPVFSIDGAEQIIITASAGDSELQTKTERQDDGSVFWKPGDEISIFYGSGVDGGSKFVSQNEDVVDIANFSGSIGVITGGNEIAATDTYFWGVYPYSAATSCDGESVTTILPAEQLATAGTFADDLFLTVGKSKGLRLAFFNVCGGIRFAVGSPGVKKVTFRGNNNEVLAGKVKIGFGSNNRPAVSEVIDGKTELTLTAPDGGSFVVGETYYFVALPTLLSSGYTMTFYKTSEEGVKTSSKSVELKRSTFGNLHEADADVNYVDYVQFPDPNLKSYILALFDDDEDGRISISESVNIQNVNCSERGISDLSGLEKCPNLKYLNFNGNNVSRVDLAGLSKLETIVAYGNPVKSLVLNNDTALTALYLQDVNTNALSGTTISINAYTQAPTLYLAFAGTQFNTLNLTNSTVLTAYDVAENIQLAKLVASGNPLVTAVDFSTLTALEHLDVHSCGLTALNVDTNVALESFDCSRNEISELNIDNNVALTSFNCSDNNLTALRVTNNDNLVSLDVSKNDLMNLNVRKNVLLKVFNISDNSRITALALGYNTELETVKTANTALTDIDLSLNTKLKVLDLRGCASMHIIDLSANTALTTLDVFGTSLATLDISMCPLLTNIKIPNKVGVSVMFASVKGVVFYVSGQTVKIVSANQTYCDWSSAKTWCSSLGSGWYLPSKDELSTIYNNKTALNSTLSLIGGTQFGRDYYWSSTEDPHSSPYAYRVYFGSGDLSSSNEYNSNNVRAVRAF